MSNPKPAPFNVVPNDTTGTTWALPEGAIFRLGKGTHSRHASLGDVALSPDGTHFVAGTGMGLWWYDVSSMLPIALWETEQGLINCVEFSKDGKRIAITNWDGIVKVLDVQSGNCLAKMKRKIYLAANYIAFSPDSKWVATAVSNMSVIEVFGAKCGECVSQPQPDARGKDRNTTFELSFSPNSKIIAATFTTPVEAYDNIVSVATKEPYTYLWHPETGERIAKFAGGKFTFSPDSRLLACASPDDTENGAVGVHRCVSVWDIETKDRIACFREHKNRVDNLIFSPCGQFLASSDSGGTLRVWEIATGVQKKDYTYYGVDSKNLLVNFLRWMLKKVASENAGRYMPWVKPFYSPEGTLYTTVFPRSTEIIEVWDVDRCEKLSTYERQTESIGAEWFSECPQLAIAHTLSNNSATSDKTHTFLTLREPTCYPEPLAFSPNGKTLASTGVRNGVVFWNVEGKHGHKTLMKDRHIDSFTFLANGSLLVVDRTDENSLEVCDIRKPNKIIDSISIPGLSWPIVFAPTGDRIAMARVTSNKDGNDERPLYIWNIQSHENMELDTGHSDGVTSMMFSPDGSRLVLGRWNGIVRLWNVEIGEEIAAAETCDTIRGITFSPCGNVIAGAIEGEIRLWSAENLSLIRTIPQPENNQRAYALAFSPCGRHLASGAWWSGTKKMAICLWNVATGENIHTFWGHTTDVQSLAFSPDGTLLASGSFNGTILLWDVTPYLGM